MNHELNAIETIVDEHFENNPLLKFPFCVLYSFVCEIAALQLVEKGSVGIEFLSPLTFVFEKDLDLRPLSLKESRGRYKDIEELDPAFKELMKCANLNLVFPFIHSGVYKYERINENSSTVDYTSVEVRRAELVDIVLTNLSIPMIPPVRAPGAKDYWTSLRRRLERRETPDVIKSIVHIENTYRVMTGSYHEAQLVPDTFYESLGFTSGEAFRVVRQALGAICKAYMDTTVFVHTYARHHQIDHDLLDKLTEGLAMAAVPRTTIKEITLRISQVNESDFEKFAEFFFEDGTTRSSISKRFLPPFWNLDGTLYFSPGAAFMSMSTRNLLISLQNHSPFTRKYKFHQQVSQLFEPMLLQRAGIHFQKHGIAVAFEKKIRGTDIDMLAYCERSNTILIIQAKATLYPEGARMVRNLDARIGEAANQLRVFDNLSPTEKKDIINACFPGVGEKDPEQLNAILTNSSFGTFASWERMRIEKIVPLNCNILRHVLPQCAGLADLPKKIDEYIESCVELVNGVVLDKVFEIGRHIITQKNLDVNLPKLYKENLVGE